MSKLRQRTRHMLYAGLAGASAVGIVFAAYATVSGIRHHAKENEIREEYRRQIAKLEQARLNEEKQMVRPGRLRGTLRPAKPSRRKTLCAPSCPKERRPRICWKAAAATKSRLQKSS